MTPIADLLTEKQTKNIKASERKKSKVLEREEIQKYLIENKNTLAITTATIVPEV